MKPVRYNIFKKTHKSLGTMMFETGYRIQQTSFTKPEEATETIKYINQVTRSFENHIANEDSIIYHAVSLAAPYIIALMEQNNAKILELADAVTLRVKEYRNISTKQHLVDFGNDLLTDYFSFTAIGLQQINKEDTVINELLWNNYSDMELKTLETSINNNTRDIENLHLEYYYSKRSHSRENLLLTGVINADYNRNEKWQHEKNGFISQRA